MNEIPFIEQLGDHLQAAIADSSRPPQPRRRNQRALRGRRMLVAIAASAVIAAAATGVALVAIGARSADSAWDQHVLRAAEIALPKPDPNTIVRVSVTQTMTPSARGDSAYLVPRVDAEGWFQQGPPWRSVTREQVPGHAPTWQTGSRIFDPASGRVYVAPSLPSSHPHFTLTKQGRNGFFTLRIATSYGAVRELVTTAQARALRTGADAILWVASVNGDKLILHAALTPKASARASSAEQPISTSLNFPAQLYRLLQSKQARVAGRVIVGGRAAIKIAISGVPGYQNMTYYVDPRTYQPIELDEYGSSSKNLTRLVFHAYQQLPTKRNAGLLRLHVYPRTIVDRNPADFYQHIPALLFW